MRRWKGWKDGVADEEENVVMVDVHVSSKSPERVKAVDGMLDESREGSSPSVSDDLVERSSRREKRSVSPSPSDGRTAASEYLDHGDDFKEKTEELDYEEVPQQPSIDSSYENVKSEPAEGSVHVSTKKASRSSEGRLRAAIHESNETAARNATVDGFVRERSVTPARYPVNQAPSEKRRREGRRDPSRDERKHRSSPESRAVRQEPEKSVKTADELFKKTTTQPAIYYVALTDEQVAERSKRKAAEAEMLAAKRAAAALNQRKETKSKEEKTKTTVGPEGVRHARSRSPRAARTTRRSPHSRSPRHRR
ncbi:hypothetical protein Tcan_06016 [Toxocara canis]|uniref:Uncharacterized protein n=1 Tax=Toxocara canis TaxID=6265 RepID=A0A0B2V0V0_TOXCA|nr:hypothetical protein Tcan_06016 [Toxocara canis]